MGSIMESRRFLIVSVVCILVIYMSCGPVSRKSETPEARWRSGPAAEQLHEGGVHWRNPTREAKARTNILFLKTHKCGSTTVQNILMRFGYARHLDFVLPHAGNYMGFGTAHFHPNCVAKEIMSPNKTFNIFAHHSRFHYEKMKAVMEPDAAFVTIIREPSYVFESLYYYYDFARPMRMSLKQLVSSPKDWPRVRQNGVRMIYGTNQISWDLGFNTLTFYNKTRNKTDIVRTFIREIDRQFDLVMITEYMEASLVLLCNLMNWPLEHAVHLRLNERRYDLVERLDPGERHVVHMMNPIDVQVYQHFIDKFRGLVRDYGVQKMKSQIEKLLNLNSDMRRNCMFSAYHEGHRKTVRYFAQNTQDTLCYYVSLNELEFTQKLREDQFERVSTLRELDDLMTG